MSIPDVCLLLEGTYPFVKGGVSSWVHQLVLKLPHLNFTIFHVSPKRGFYDAPAYEMPKNVVGLEQIYLHDYTMAEEGSQDELREKVERFRGMVNDMRDGKIEAFTGFIKSLEEDGAGGMNSFDLLQTKESWKVLIETYRKEAEEESFLNFFWTWRYAYMPLFNVLAAKAPLCGLYHTISTGYAGLLAAACKVRYDRPMLLTEHGIYTKERRIEINRAEWIEDWESGEVMAERRAPYFKRFWVRQFQMMARVNYEFADEIFTLYEGNKEMQAKDGADPNCVKIVPNGIDLRRFGECADKYDARKENDRYTVGFVGRVCPIKDVKTLIYAARLVAEEVPDVHFRVIGPMDEDPDYADECQKMIELLDLQENVFLEGPANVLEEYWKLDVLILTSISEAQPLVVLEGGAVGLPCVATDVGSCSELLFGRTAQDKKYGPGGLITPIATPGATAEALLRFYREPETRKGYGLNLRARVIGLYDQVDMINAYKDIYERNLKKGAEKV